MSLKEAVSRRDDVVDDTIQLFEEGNSAERLAAVAELGGLGATPRIVAALLRAARDEEAPVRWTAMDAIRRVKGLVASEVLPTLVKALQDPAGKVRWRAAEALRNLGRDGAVEAVPALVVALGDSQPWVRWHADAALNDICSHSEMVPFLVDILARGETSQREAAALKLGGLRLAAAAAHNALCRALETDRDAAVRVAAAVALMKLERTGDEVEKCLASALRDDNERVRYASALALSRLGWRTPETLHVLRSSLADADEGVKSAAALALAVEGYSEESLLPSLVRAFREQDLAIVAWRATCDLLAADPGLWEKITIPVDDLKAILSEDTAAGVLPTIGLKAWRRHPPLHFPTREKPYPWTDLGVRHNWMTHDARAQGDAHVLQVCIHIDWNPHIHWITLAHRIASPRRTPRFLEPAAFIEGRPVGHILQSGGHLTELHEMRRLKPPYKTNRLDFLMCTDLRLVQYLAFGAACEALPQECRTEQEALGASIWNAFNQGFGNLLGKCGLWRALETEWFSESGWDSNHYGRRYEKDFGEIAPGLTELERHLESPWGHPLQQSVCSLLHPLLDQMHNSLWTEAMETWPPIVKDWVQAHKSEFRFGRRSQLA